MNLCKIFALLLCIGLGASLAPVMAADLPIFDAHVHYSRDAWKAYPPVKALAKLKKAGVKWALVSSTPDDGTLKLWRHDKTMVMPELRPYHGEFHSGNWARSKKILRYLKTRLEIRKYFGIGEFHLHEVSEDDRPVLIEIAKLALKYNIPLHVHSGAKPIEMLFKLEPNLTILWAHAGMSEPAEVVGKMLDKYNRLYLELSFRAHEIAQTGKIDPLWRAIFERHPDRALIGTDTYTNSQWQNYHELIADQRLWLKQLPPKLAKQIAYQNAGHLFKLKLAP